MNGIKVKTKRPIMLKGKILVTVEDKATFNQICHLAQSSKENETWLRLAPRTTLPCANECTNLYEHLVEVFAHCMLSVS